MTSLFRSHTALPGPAATAGLLLLSTALLLWPAFWNGYPLFFFDSGDYIDSSFTHTPQVWRTLPYGLFLAATHFDTSLWIPVAVQAFITAWLLWELTLAVAPLRPVAVMLTATVLAAVGTGAPWFASQIMPDPFTAPMVLGMVLLGISRARPLRLALIALVTVAAIGAHASHIGTAVMLAVGLLGIALLRFGPEPRVGLPFAVLALGVLVTPLSHEVYTGEAYMSRSAPIMAFARLLRDGEAQDYLREACPEAGYSLCPYVDQLKSGTNAANDFLWDQSSPFYRIEGWKEWRRFAPEARTITVETLKAHPGRALRGALSTWLEQLATYGTGSGLVPKLYEASEVQKQRFPQESGAYFAARQYAGFDLGALSRVHVTVLTVAMVLVLLFALRGLRHRDRVAQLLLLLILAALVNAAVTAIFSNPDDRYQARLVWLFVPALVLTLSAQRGRAAP